MKTARCLGVYVGHDEISSNKKNWIDKKGNIEGLLNSWKHRKLSIFGKVTIIKTLALSKLSYMALNFVTPDIIFKDLDKLFYNFLWYKRERIKRNTLIGNLANGGIQMMDVESHFNALKASWVAKIINHESSSLHIGKAIINNFAKDKLLLKMNSTDITYLDEIPPFYKQVLVGYFKSDTSRKPETQKEILNEVIWGNKHIRRQVRKIDNTFMFNNWISKDIIYIKDLKFTNGKLDEIFIYNKITDKRNILCEIYTLNKALHKYKDIIGTIIPKLYINKKNDIIPKESKYYYKKIVTHKIQKPSYKLIKETFPNINEEEIMQTNILKVKCIKDKQIAEFNYKVINNILICNTYLSKWLPGIEETCIVCKRDSNLIHMVYECINVKKTWISIGKMFNINIGIKEIILGLHEDLSINYCICIMQFFIYKFWLLCIKNIEKYSPNNFKHFLINEIKFRICVMKHMKEKRNVENMKLIEKCIIDIKL